jgi:hypothetical protein
VSRCRRSGLSYRPVRIMSPCKGRAIDSGSRALLSNVLLGNCPVWWVGYLSQASGRTIRTHDKTIFRDLTWATEYDFMPLDIIYEISRSTTAPGRSPHVRPGSPVSLILTMFIARPADPAHGWLTALKRSMHKPMTQTYGKTECSLLFTHVLCCLL